MTRRPVGRWLGVAFGLLIPLSACGGGDTPPPPSTQSPRNGVDATVSMGDRLGVPMTIHQAADGTWATDGAVATPVVSNTRDNEVTITAIEAVSDPGLLVSYLGHTTCEHGCIGTGYWSDPSTQRIVQQGTDGQFPVTVPRDDQRAAKREHLIFLLRVAPSAMQELRSGCLWLRALRITFADGQHAVINGWGNRTILGAFADDHALPGPVPFGPKRCPLEPTR
jgi:hypothetical protein